MGWLICAYFTTDKLYTKHAKRLIESIKKFELPYDIHPIETFNDWYKGTQYKPIFLKKILEKYSGHSIVYVDVDAIFCGYPEFFDTLHTKMPEVNIAVHVLDHNKYRRKNHPPELLSGTIFLRNNMETSIIIQEWILELNKDPKLWDQRALEKVLKNHPYYNLPEEYCTIFDYMSSVKNPIIKHFQASREIRRDERDKAKKKKPRLKVVENNSVVKLGKLRG